ncbi:A/G-specific adenine glycosylase [Desulfobaculum sp.]
MTTHHHIAATLVDWFHANQRPLPWRKTYSPYHVWVSEIMLQQTQMDRAVPYFERWMTRFPDVPTLAAASEDDVLKYWEGLGYYSRARNIRKAARIIMDEHGGAFPTDVGGLLALPGVGPYTAGAIASLAYQQDVPAIDANVERVFARLFDIDTPVKEKDAKRAVADHADRLLPPGGARDFNQAVMEFGALVCTPRAPRCEACPLSAQCEAYRLGIVAHRPVPGKRQDITPLSIVAGVLLHEGRFFIQKRLEDSVWGGLWEFPGGSIEDGETPEQAAVREFREETDFRVSVVDKIDVVRHGYTRYRITLHCFLLSLDGPGTTPYLTAASEYRWSTSEGLDGLAFPGGHRKLIDIMRTDLRYAHLFSA